MRGPKVRPVEDRFWKYVHKTKTCWLWTGHSIRNGYGIIWCNLQRKQIVAHRVSYSMHNGNIPKRMLVLHKCDVKNCVNPSHLFVGNHRDNMLDYIKKGFFKRRVGSESSRAILSEDDVLTIRTLLKKECLSQYKIAKIYGVSRSAIGSINLRTSWSHI